MITFAGFFLFVLFVIRNDNVRRSYQLHIANLKKKIMPTAFASTSKVRMILYSLGLGIAWHLISGSVNAAFAAKTVNSCLISCRLHRLL